MEGRVWSKDEVGNGTRLSKDNVRVCQARDGDGLMMGCLSNCRVSRMRSSVNNNVECDPLPR